MKCWRRLDGLSFGLVVFLLELFGAASAEEEDVLRRLKLTLDRVTFGEDVAARPPAGYAPRFRFDLKEFVGKDVTPGLKSSTCVEDNTLQIINLKALSQPIHSKFCLS